MASSAVPGTAAGIHRHRRDVAGVLFQLALLFTLIVTLGALVTLIADVLRGGMGVLTDRGGDFVTSGLSSLPARAGVWQGIVGSLEVAAIVVLLSFPVGIATAIYLEEYARDTRVTRFVTVNIRNLAGVPSVVYGLLGLSVFVQAMRDFTGPGGGAAGRSVMSAGLTLSVLVLPIVVITTSEALRAVPSGIREAGFGVGATRWEVIRRLVLPSAAPGVLTGTVLSLSRALGETAPLILVGAATGFFATGSQGFVEQLQGSFSALPMIVFGWARRPQAEFRELTSAAILVLLGVTLVANAAAILLRDRFARRQP